MIPLTTVVLSRALWLYALLLFLVPVCKAQVIVSPCSSDSFSDSALVPPRNYTFSTADITFCPASTLSGNDFRSWVLIPEGASDMDTNGTYCFEDPLARFGGENVCVFNDAGKTLLILSLAGISLAPPGEVFINFTSRAGRRTGITVRYGPGGFSNLESEYVLDLGTGDILPQLWNSTGLDRTNEVLLCQQGTGGLEAVPSSFRIDSERLREQCSDLDPQSPPTRYTILYTSPELGVYTFVLRWPRAASASCTCTCTDCSGCSSNQSMPVIINVTNSVVPTPSVDPTMPTESSGSDTGLIVGIVVGVSAGGLVLVVLALTCYWHKRKHNSSTSKFGRVLNGSQSSSNTYQEQEMISQTQGGAVVKGNTTGSSFAHEAVDYERSVPDSPNRTIHFVIDELLKKNTDWFSDFKSLLESKHRARANMPAFLGSELTKQLQSLLQDENCDCLYLLWQGSLEQLRLRQNGTSDSSELSMARIAQESMFCDNSEKKVVWVQFGLESSKPSLDLANGILAVNCTYLPGSSDISGNRCAEEVFKSVGPMLSQRFAALSQVMHRAAWDDPSEYTSTSEPSFLNSGPAPGVPSQAQTDPLTRQLLNMTEGIQKDVKVVLEFQQQQVVVAKRTAKKVDQLGEDTAETKEAALESLDTTREIQEALQKATYGDSQVVTTTEAV